MSTSPINSTVYNFSSPEASKIFIHQNSDGLFSLDLKGNFLNVNKGLIEIVETPQEELMKMSFIPFCAPHDSDKIIGFFKLASQGYPQKFEADFISGKGRNMILNIDLLPMRVGENYIGVYGIAKDITPLKISEKQLDEKNRYLRLYAEIVDYLVLNEKADIDFEYIFKRVGIAIEAQRVFYLGKSIKVKNTQETNSCVRLIWQANYVNKKHKVPGVDFLKFFSEQKLSFEYDSPHIFDSTTNSTISIKSFLKEYGNQSLFLLPVYIKKEYFGLIGIEHKVLPTVWSSEEQEFIRSLVKTITSFIEKKISDAFIKLKEQELLETNMKFESLVQEGSDIIGILNPEGIYKFVSASSKRILGIPSYDFIGKNAFSFIHPEDKARVIDQFTSISSNKHIYIPPFRFKAQSGKWRWVETQATNLINVPQVQGIVTNSKDVTDKIEQDNLINELNERYKLVAQITQDIIYDWNIKTNEINRFFEGKNHSLGYDLPTMKTKEFWNSQIHPSDFEAYNRELKNKLEDSHIDYYNFQYRISRDNGSFATIIDRAHIIRDKNGIAIKVIGATSDISEILSNRNELKLANTRFKYAMKATREMIWDWDIHGKKATRSKIFKNLYGNNLSNKADHIAWLEKIVRKDKDRVEISLQKALANSTCKKWSAEYAIKKDNGNKAYLIDRGYIIRNEEGKAVRMVGATLDVSESRNLMKKIKNQNKVLKEIAWEQAHIVRAPIAQLKGLIEVLDLETRNIDFDKEVLELLKQVSIELDETVINSIRKIENL